VCKIAKSRDEEKLTRLAMKPDFTVGLGYMLMPTGSSWRAMRTWPKLSMNLPWLNRERHDGEAKQADAATDVSQAELDARAATVFLEIRQAQIKVLAAEKRVKLYRDTLLPQAEASFKASTAAYQNNRAEFMSLIDAQNLLLDIQTAYYKASAATDEGMAQLERAIGAPIANTTNRNTGGEANDNEGKEAVCIRCRRWSFERGSCGWISDSEGDAPCFSGIEYRKPRRFHPPITAMRATRH
jgi:outer membrane protein TolC